MEQQHLLWKLAMAKRAKHPKCCCRYSDFFTCTTEAERVFNKVETDYSVNESACFSIVFGVVNLVKYPD